MNEISRREFIVAGGTALTLATLPVTAAKEETTAEIRTIRHVDESGANLLLYFVNTLRRGRHLVPRDETSPSYLVTQLSPQSLHEMYFYSAKNLPPTQQLAARLSGPSFFVFRLWPRWNRTDKLPREWRISYDVSAFLDWHDTDRFALQTADDVPVGDWKMLCDFGPAPVDFAKIKDVAISATDVGDGPYDVTYYQKLIHKVLNQKSTAHISIFELPAGILMTFIDPTSDVTARMKGAVSNVMFRVAQNHTLTRRQKTIRERRFELRPKGGERIVRTVTERWSADVSVVSRGRVLTDFTISELPPALRAIGLVRTGALPSAPNKPAADCDPKPDRNTGYLPTLIDQAELLLLNQLGNTQFASQRFDIRAEGPFRLTDLGGSLHLHYKNYDTRGLPTNVSLVEYEHVFEAGRDNYIKIARIGVCPKTTLRMLHLAIAERKIRGGVSYVDYKEYCDWLETERDFPDCVGDVSTNYGSPIGPGVSTKWLRHPFSRVEAIVGRLTPIETVLLADGCNDPNAMQKDPTFLDPRAFWVYREGVGRNRDEAGLLGYPHKFYDRNRKGLGVRDTALLFLRRDFFGDKALIDRWLGPDSTVQSLRMSAWDDRRHRISLGGQVTAFTPDDGRAMGCGNARTTMIEAAGSAANRPNQMATDWLECYFDVQRATDGMPSPFDDSTFPVFPQVRQARVYLDHVQHYARAKRTSVVEYATEYLNAGLDATGNPRKFVVAHTEQFKANQVTTLAGRTIGDLDADLPGAWDAIKRTFREAGESLGALVNPEPALERISLTKSALSMPRSQSLQDSATQGLTLDPREIFKSLDAELFSGIRLSDILGLLNLDEAPQYLLTKLPPLPSSAEVLAAIASDPVIHRAYTAATAFKQTVDELKQKYDAAQRTLDAADSELRRIRAAIDESLPNRAKIEGAARDRFEAAALAAFQDVACATPECLDRFRIFATLEVLRFLNETGANRPTPDVAVFLTDTADKAATKLLSELAAINPQSPRYIELKEQFDGFANKVLDVTTWYSAIKPSIERSEFDSIAIEALSKNVALDMGVARKLAELTERVFRLYELVKPSVPLELVQQWRDALAKLDAARRLNVAYLQARRDRILNDAEDACRTLPPAVFDVVQVLEAATTCGKQYAAELSQRWTADRVGAMKLVRDRENRRRCVEEVVMSAVRKLLPKDSEARLAAAQANLRTQLSAVQTAADKWKQAATEEARSVSDRFRTEVDREIAKITNSEEVGQAIATYERVSQILDRARVQDLTTDWNTTLLRAADLGFLRFEPRAPGETKLSMRASLHMEMDLLSQPPLPVRSEAFAQTELTGFRITFLRVISVDFNRVLFTSGTGKSTTADVKIASVDFAGSLSFIQALQSLLAGLVDGLRVDLGTDHLSIGYQSPSLDLSSPGFTFANFFVGISLLIFFDRTPMRLRFSLADVERKATVSAGIYGGCFFCALTMDTKRGVIGTDTALELGAYFGIRFGPFSGYVKFMVGLRYTRSDEGVTLIGYFIAEGSLSVWVITVSARLYMGVLSQNSVAEGFCIASYSVKVGFIKKTFESGYSKRIAGATQNSPNSGQHRASIRRSQSVVSALYDGPRALLMPPLVDDRQPSLEPPINDLHRLVDEHPELIADDFEPLRRDEFSHFVSMYFATVN